MKRTMPVLLLGAVLAFTLALPVPSAAIPTGEPGRLAACFGNHGVQFGTFSAWLCGHKLGDDPSGSLYFALSDDTGLNNASPKGQMDWTKLHAAPGAFYAWENYSQPWGAAHKRADGRIIALDEGPAGQCIVVWPSWAADPAECFLVTDGGAVVAAPHSLTPIEEYSVDEYQANAPAIPLEYR